MLRKVGLLSLVIVGLSAYWCSGQVAAAPPPSMYLATATIYPGFKLIGDGADYTGDQQGVKCGINFQSNDFLFNPQDLHYSPPRDAWVDLSVPAANPCDGSLLSSQPVFSSLQEVQYMIVRQVGTVAGTALKNAHIVLPNGTLRFGYGGCTQQVQVTCTGTDGNNKPNHWSISTISPHVGELVQTIGRTTQVVGYYYAPFQIDLVESTSTGSR